MPMPSTFLQYLFMLSGYPLARWVLPHISSREHAIIVHLTIGISFCSFIFGQEMFLAFTMISIGYFILDKNPNDVFKVSFIMNSIIHCIHFCYSSHHEVSNLTMIVFYKIVATSFNLDDGRKIKLMDEHLTENQRSLHLTKKPTYYEWIAYCFTPFGSISNSFYEFKFFDRLLEIGTKKQTVSDTSKAKAKDLLTRSFFHGLIYFTFRHPLKFSFYQTECFHSFNLLARIFFVLLLGLTIYCQDFMFWNVVDAGLYEAGFADYGIEPEEDYTSLTFEYLLSMKTIDKWSFAFNHTNEVFWFKYLTSRAPLDNSLVEFIVKPIYKGFWGGIMFASFEKVLFLLAEIVLHIILPRYTKSFWPTYIFVQVMMVLNRISIRNKTIYSFFYMNYVIYFISWLLSVLIFVAAFFLKDSIFEKRTKNTEYFKDAVITAVLSAVPKSSSFDIVYMVDSTGSMGSYLIALKEQCINISNELKNTFPYFHFQFGAIFYRDPIDNPNDKHETFLLSEDVDSLKKQTDEILPNVGGYGPKDWVGAYKIALDNMNWRNGTRLIIHIANAPAHGHSYCGRNNHEEENDKLAPLLKRCCSLGIRIIGMPISGDYTRKSFEQAEIDYNSISHTDKFYKIQLSLNSGQSDPLYFKYAIVSAVVSAIPKSTSFDIVYMIDATGSMDSYIFAAEQQCINISNKLKSEFPVFDFQFGAIFYRDPVDEQGDKHETFQLSADVDLLKRNIETIRTYGGGDGPEDWVGAYKIALENINWRNGARLIIHIADAPAHGHSYCGSNNHEEENDKLAPLIRQCCHCGIKIIGMPINEWYSRKSFEKAEIDYNCESNPLKFYQIHLFSE